MYIICTKKNLDKGFFFYVEVSGLKKYIVFTISAFLFSVGIVLFVQANNLAPGGVSGLSILLSRMFPLEVGTIFFLLNIPILILGWIKLGGKLILSTIYEILWISLFSNLLEIFPPITKEPVLGAVFGGILIAAGMGFSLRAGATTGGLDIIVKVIKMKIPHVKTGKLHLIMDIIVIAAGGIVFRNFDAVLCSILSTVVTSKLLDVILYGTDHAKLIFVISTHAETITERILKEMESGVTYLNGRGAYQEQDKKIIMCVIRKQRMYRMEEIVRQEDENAFMIVSGASEIYGEGFKSYYGEKL